MHFAHLVRLVLRQKFGKSQVIARDAIEDDAPGDPVVPMSESEVILGAVGAGPIGTRATLHNSSTRFHCSLRAPRRFWAIVAAAASERWRMVAWVGFESTTLGL
jgi:hypothetical protein